MCEAAIAVWSVMLFLGLVAGVFYVGYQQGKFDQRKIDRQRRHERGGTP